MTGDAFALETLSVVVPEAAVPAYEAALQTACRTVGLFRSDDDGRWLLEGVKPRGEGEAALAVGLALAAAATGVQVAPARRDTPAEGWLARNYESFPEQLIGRRFAVRGTHLVGAGTPGRMVLTLDAGLAFGSGEHGSTRGCLRALERVACRRPRRILDMGCGSGILALAAARLLHRRVLAVDIEPWSVRVAAGNVGLNRLGHLVRAVRSDGWVGAAVRAGAPYDLVFANILARPLCAMARPMRARVAPGATVILAGLLASQVRWVLAAYRRQGFVRDFVLQEGRWATLVLRAP